MRSRYVSDEANGSIRSAGACLFNFCQFRACSPFVPRHLLVNYFQCQNPIATVVEMFRAPLHHTISRFSRFLGRRTIRLYLPKGDRGSIQNFSSISTNGVDFLVIIYRRLQARFASTSIHYFRLNLDRRVISRNFVRSLLRRNDVG